ncbi:MAG: hypothetical protein KAJ40_07145, partial [Alphaproteobacteria bacterium]|nr:hypothetical protein [Alphaproteobacteria bacterium]
RDHGPDNKTCKRDYGRPLLFISLQIKVWKKKHKRKYSEFILITVVLLKQTLRSVSGGCANKQAGFVVWYLITKH